MKSMIEIARDIAEGAEREEKKSIINEDFEAQFQSIKEKQRTAIYNADEAFERWMELFGSKITVSDFVNMVARYYREPLQQKRMAYILFAMSMADSGTDQEVADWQQS